MSCTVQRSGRFLCAQTGSVTMVPNLAINSGHETIQTQYDQAYSNYNFAGYGVWEASCIDQVLP